MKFALVRDDYIKRDFTEFYFDTILSLSAAIIILQLQLILS